MAYLHENREEPGGTKDHSGWQSSQGKRKGAGKMAARTERHGSIGRGLRWPDTNLGEDYGPAGECVLYTVGWFIPRFLSFSSARSSYGQSRLPCPCRLKSRRQNTCEPSSASCSLCRSSLPCKPVLRVTNTYVLSFVVSSYSLSSARMRSSSSISLLLACRTAGFSL